MKMTTASRRRRESGRTCTALPSHAEKAHPGALALGRGAKRKRKRRCVITGQKPLFWSNSTSALTSMAAAFLLLPHCYNNIGSFIHAADDGGSYKRDPQTDLWLDAEVDSNNNFFENDKIARTGDHVEHEEAPSPVSRKKKEPPPEEDHNIPPRSREEELQLHAEQQHNSQARIDKERSINAKEQQQNQQFMDWCQNVLGIQTSLEIHTFYYYDYMTAIMTYPEASDAADGDDDDDNYFEFDTDHAATPSTAATTTATSTTITPSFSLPPTKTSETSPSSSSASWQDPPMIPVRGLRATRDINQGEVIISIPFQALLTVSTTIDQDPVLSRVMGKEARQEYGWALGQDYMETNTDADDSSSKKDIDFFELPLLAMALLHHYKLGTSSPLYPYIHLLRKSPLDQFPFLWSKQSRHKQYRDGATTTVAKGIQTVARSIRLEMKDMYQTVVLQLVRDHPAVFGQSQKQQYDTLDDEEWAFSFENFQWAFAMVNSRHWLLPILDLEQQQPQQTPPSGTSSSDSPSVSSHMIQPQGSVDGVPPAEMPTDAWVHQDEEGEEDRSDDYPHNNNNNNNNNDSKSPTYHSFLAPVADLLNFGPPCTRGRYNQETHTFDIVASCDFSPGQEVTFWYSDECDEIIIGNYGFSHPMVPKCPTVEDYRIARDKWKQKAANLQEALEDAYEDMDVMDTELQHIQHILANCDCCDTTRARHYHPQGQQRQQNHQQQEHRPPRQIRGGRGTMMKRSSGRSNGHNHNQHRSNQNEKRQSRGEQRSLSSSDDDVERHGVRRMWAGRSAL